MSECCPKKENSLKINLGKLISVNSLKKIIWSIASNIQIEDKPEVILITEKNTEEAIKILDTFTTKINYTLIKTTVAKLSNDKAYETCRKFCDVNTLQLSTNSLFYKPLKLEKACSFKSFLLPKYVQEAIEQYGQNMCEYYAKECMKYPVNNNFFYIENSDPSETIIFCVEEDIEEDELIEVSVEEIIQASEIIRK